MGFKFDGSVFFPIGVGVADVDDGAIAVEDDEAEAGTAIISSLLLLFFLFANGVGARFGGEGGTFLGLPGRHR